MHRSGIVPVGTERKRARRSGVEEELVKYGSPLPVRIYRHWDKDDFAVEELPNEGVSQYLAVHDGITSALPHEFQVLVGLKIFDSSGCDKLISLTFAEPTGSVSSMGLIQVTSPPKVL